MKKIIIKILYELYKLHRSIGSRSSWGFYNGIKSLKEVDNSYIKTHYDVLDQNIYRIGPHIQMIINDLKCNRYPRLINDRYMVYQKGELNCKDYNIYDEMICKRINYRIYLRYLKILKLRYFKIQLGMGHKKDPYLKYGVGYIILWISRNDLNKYTKSLIKTFTNIRMTKKEVLFIRNDYTQFMIILKFK